MSVYKLIPTHYVKLHHDGPRPLPTPSCTTEQFENLKLLLRSSNSKLTSLATTIKELREQLCERDDKIAELTAAANARVTTMVHSRVEVRSTDRPSAAAEPQDVVVDVTSEIQVRLKVELVDQGPNKAPLVKVASTVVTRRPSNPVPTVTAEAKRTEGASADSGAFGDRYGTRASSAAPGPVRSSGYIGGHLAGASPLYGSLMWRTRQRAKELGYRFVWSRYGKILVKKDVQSPPMYILDEADLRKMG